MGNLWAEDGWPLRALCIPRGASRRRPHDPYPRSTSALASPAEVDTGSVAGHVGEVIVAPGSVVESQKIHVKAEAGRHILHAEDRRAALEVDGFSHGFSLLDHIAPAECPRGTGVHFETCGSLLQVAQPSESVYCWLIQHRRPGLYRRQSGEPVVEIGVQAISHLRIL